jgi:hypothetical protein
MSNFTEDEVAYLRGQRLGSYGIGPEHTAPSRE